MTRTSIIIPTRNRRLKVLRAIRSVLSQPGCDELLVVDDCSTDGTVEEIERRFKDVIVIKGTGMGPSAARNLGLERSSGDAVIFVDSDDLLPQNSISSRLEAFRTRESERTLPFGRAIAVSNKGECLSEPRYGFDRPATKSLTLADLVRRTMPCCLPVFPAGALREVGAFDETLRIGEDMELAARMHMAGWRFHPTESIVYHVVQHTGDRLTTSRANFYSEIFRTYRTIAAQLPPDDVVARASLASSIYVTARDCSREARRDEALALFRLANEVGKPSDQIRSRLDLLTVGRAPYGTEQIMERVKKTVLRVQLRRLSKCS